MISGTPMYMAPEQALGQTLDHRTDLFSLGSVLYQIACGRPPFRAPTTLAVLRRVAEDTPRTLQEIVPEIPDWLVVIINKLLAKNPEDRFQSAKEVADLLAKCHVELQSKGAVTCVAGTYSALRDEPQSSHHAPRDEPSTAATSSKNRPQPGQTLSQNAAVQPSAAPQGSSRRSETATSKRTLLLVAGIIAITAIVASVMISRHYRNIMNSQLASADPQPSEPTSKIGNQKSAIKNRQSKISPSTAGPPTHRRRRLRRLMPSRQRSIRRPGPNI